MIYPRIYHIINLTSEGYFFDKRFKTFLSNAPLTNLFELFSLNLIYRINRKIDFFVSYKEIILIERLVFMINIIKQEIEMDACLKQKLEFICDFCNTTPTIINGSIRKLDKTNLTYIEPHKVIIKNITFLVFNYSTDIYIKNLNNKIQLSQLENYIKSIN